METSETLTQGQCMFKIGLNWQTALAALAVIVVVIKFQADIKKVLGNVPVLDKLLA